MAGICARLTPVFGATQARRDNVSKRGILIIIGLVAVGLVGYQIFGRSGAKGKQAGKQVPGQSFETCKR